MNNSIELLRNALYETIYNYRRNVRNDAFDVTIYVNTYFYYHLRSDENFTNWCCLGNGPNPTIDGYPIYIVNDDNHPDFKIFVEPQNA